MAKETSLWSWLAKAKRILKANLQLDRVENACVTGMPDVHGQELGRQPFWLELKSADRPARAATCVRFATKDREAQVEWARKRVLVGGLSWMLLQVGAGAERKIYLIWGGQSQEVHDGACEARLARMSFCEPDASAVDVIRAASRF